MTPLLSLILLAAPPRPPPPVFLDLLSHISEAKAHVNTRLPTGWEVPPFCQPRKVTPLTCDPPGMGMRERCNFRRFCRDQTALWRTSIVDDAKDRDQHVVQEIWAFRYPSAKAARRAQAAMDDMTFRKRPYETWVRGDLLIAVEGRFRFRRSMKRLTKYVARRLATASR